MKTQWTANVDRLTTTDKISLSEQLCGPGNGTNSRNEKNDDDHTNLDTRLHTKSENEGESKVFVQS